MRGSNATLVSPQFGGAFSELRPAQLLRRLSRAGLHLLPQDADAGAAGTRLKDAAVEAGLAADLSLLIAACGCSFQSCAYNRRACLPPRRLPALRRSMLCPLALRLHHAARA